MNLSICKNYSKNKLKSLLKKRLRELFLKQWTEFRDSYNEDHGKLNTYFKFKSSFEFEQYLNINNKDKRKILTKFRISDHSLRIETGRHERVINRDTGKLVILPRSERVCQYCCDGCPEDEIHFLLKCQLYDDTRQIFLNQLVTSFPNLKNLSTNQLYIWIMSNEDIKFNKQLIEVNN